MKYLYILLILGLVFFQSCTKEDTLAFDVIESPVQATFETQSGDDDAMLLVVGTFMDLDKSGILDQNIGILSTPISGLQLTVYGGASQQLVQISTDAEGKAIFEYEKDELAGISALEWSGIYDEVPFRILYKL